MSRRFEDKESTQIAGERDLRLKQQESENSLTFREEDL